jgi:hypothetical protein
LLATPPNYVGLEVEADMVRNYEPGVVPGLLQTPATLVRSSPNARQT